MNKDSKILVVGHNDVIENSLFSSLKKKGYEKVFSSSQMGLNVLDQHQVKKFFTGVYPEYVLLGSIRSGGIAANQNHPAEFISENLMGQTNIIHAAYTHGVAKLIYFAGSCVYPKDNPQPITETRLLEGPLEETSESYSVAKIAGIKMCQAYKKEYGFNAIVAIPATIYGPGSDTHIETAHVLGALLAKFDHAKTRNENQVAVWGSGEAKREFLYAEDFVNAVLLLLDKYNDMEMINIGFGMDVTIKDLAELIADVAGFKGKILFDRTKPEGTMTKLLDSERIFKMGWKPKTSLRAGLEETYKWYKSLNENKTGEVK